VTLRYGFIEKPDIRAALSESSGFPDGIDAERAVFFGARDMVVPGPHTIWVKWRLVLFAFLYRNAVRMIDRFNLPPERTIEIARQLKI
jgi:KUP system potassium uptake protein